MEASDKMKAVNSRKYPACYWPFETNHVQIVPSFLPIKRLVFRFVVHPTSPHFSHNAVEMKNMKCDKQIY